MLRVRVQYGEHGGGSRRIQHDSKHDYLGGNVNLSPHFTFAEMTRTGQAALQDMNRTEATAFTQSLTRVCVDLLEPIRVRFGVVKVHSGFRGAAVNAAIGGSKTSQHMRGEACDFSVPGLSFDVVFRWIVQDSGIAFGQAILEGRTPTPTWIHVSLGAPWRDAALCRQALRFDGARYTPWTPAR
jgi:hypothetical protein